MVIVTIFINRYDAIYEFYSFSALRVVAREMRTTSALLESASAGLIRHAQELRQTVSTLPLLEHLPLRENCRPSKIQLVPQYVR